MCFSTSTNNDNSPLVHVKILYESDKNVETEQTDGNRDRLLKGQTLLTSYFHPLQRAPNNDDDDDDDKGLKVKKPNIFLQSKRICKRYKRLKLRHYLIRKRTGKFLVRLILVVRKNFSHHWHRFQRYKNISLVYRCIISYHLFTTELQRHIKKEIPKVPTKITTETLVTNQRVRRFILGESVREMTDQDNTSAQTVQQHIDVGPKRLLKNQRTHQSILLLSENTQESSEKDYCKLYNVQHKVFK